jgi:D-threo-aldose 1-dehydrogenase
MLFPPLRRGLRLGLGGAPLGNLFTAITDAAAQSVMAAALADGCRSFDTAPHYGHGLSEHRLGQTLRQRSRDSFSLSSKVGRLLHPDRSAPADQNGYVQCLPFRQSWDYSANGIRRSVHDSLQRLGLAQLDTVYIHDCDAGVHGEAYPGVLRQVLDEALPALQQLREEGLLRHVGLGVNDVQVCLDVLRQADLDCLLLAGRYSLIDQSALPELLPLCVARGVRIALGGVFNSGILATGVRGAQAPRFNYAPASAQWVDKVARIETLCEAFGVPLRAAALQFPLAHAAVEIVVVGAQTVAHWTDAVAMMRHPVPPGFWQALQAQGLLDATAPVPGGGP